MKNWTLGFMYQYMHVYASLFDADAQNVFSNQAYQIFS